MNDSADIKLAADRLTDALSQLEGTVRPLMSRINELEKMAREAQSFESDRADLARQLDQSEARAVDFESREEDFKSREADFQSREAAFQSREAEFQSREEQISELAAQTRQELNSVIQQVRDALGQD